MRQVLQVLAIVVVFGSTLCAAEDDAKTIVEKAMKAHFPKGVDTKNQGMSTTAKGTLHMMGLGLDFSQEVTVKYPDKLKENSELTVMNKKFNVATVFNGKEAWIRANDMDVKVTDDMMAEFKEAVYLIGLMQGLVLKDKGVKYSLVGESKIKDKPVLGVTVSREGKKDINLFVDKTTYLVVKSEMRKKDLATGQEVTEERLITEYQEIDGKKVAKKVEILRDGKPYIELEIVKVTSLEKVDDDEFAKPK